MGHRLEYSRCRRTIENQIDKCGLVGKSTYRAFIIRESEIVVGKNGHLIVLHNTGLSVATPLTAAVVDPASAAQPHITYWSEHPEKSEK